MTPILSLTLPTLPSPPQTSLTGPASIAPTTVCDSLKRASKKYESKPALCVKRGGKWLQMNFKEYYDTVIQGAKSLIKLGVEPCHGVCILGFNAPEWHIADLAAVMVSACACMCACVHACVHVCV